MKKKLQQVAFHVGRVTVHVSRWSLYVGTALLVLAVIAFTVARYLLPTITEHKPTLEQYLSERSGHQVRIESLQAHWDGLYPGARVQGLKVFALDGTRPAVQLGELRFSLSLIPLLWGKFEINNLVLVNPRLSLERLTDGRYRVSGFDPLQDDGGNRGERFVAWLFQQGRLEIENGEMQWYDHREGGSALRLERVRLTLRNNGDRHRLDFMAAFPQGLCDDCFVSLDITGNPLASEDWGGDVSLRTRKLNTRILPLIVREKLPKDFRGLFSMQLWSEWTRGRPVSIKGHTEVSELRLPIPGWNAPFEITQAGGDVYWRTRGSGWRLDVANPQFGLIGQAWDGGRLRVTYQPEASEIQIKHLNLADLTGFVTRLKSDLTATTKKETPGDAAALLDTWLAVKPGGSVENLDLRLQGDWLAPRDFSLNAELQSVSLQAYMEYPGARNLSGQLSLKRNNGSFRLNASGMNLLFPKIFRQPLMTQRISGDLSWIRHDAHWAIIGNNIRMTSEDARASGKLGVLLPHDANSPVLKLRMDFQDGVGARASRYYPASHLAPKTLAWMEQSFLGGNITKGHVIFDGPVRDFPFDQGTGKFELRAHVTRGVYQYLPGWEPIRQVEADVSINGSEVVVTGTGKIAELDASQVVVQSRDSSAGYHVVRVSGKVSGPINETLKVLQRVKPGSEGSRWLAYLPPTLQGSGSGILSLNVTVPLRAEHPDQVEGEYRFLRNVLSLPEVQLSADAIEGSVRFTESGLREGNLRARLFGGDTEMQATHQADRVMIQGQGSITAEGLASLVGSKIAPRLDGSVHWNGQWQWGTNVNDLQAEVDFRRFKTVLPAPLDHPDGWTEEKLIVRTEPSRRDRMHLVLRLGTHMSGKLQFARQGSAWNFSSGRIGIGQEVTTPPRERELHLIGEIPHVDYDQWWPLLGGGFNVPEWITHVSASIQSLTMFDRRFGQLSLDVFRRQEAWSGTVGGTSLVGTLHYTVKRSGPAFELDLERLVIPDKIHQRRDIPVDPRRLPAVTVRSKSFFIRDKPMGEMEFTAIPDERGWRIRQFLMTRPEMKLSVNGHWHYLNNAHESDFTIAFDSSNIGDTVDALGTPDQVAGGEASVKARIVWPGSPTTPRFALLNGEVDINAKKGRFLQVKARAGRLFGLLDLSAIGRYLTLDFSPVFGKGLIYDQIQGKVTIEQGNAYTRDFSIRGPATQISVGGRIGLAAEDYDLAIDVQPKVSDTVTIATWGVLGPQVAAAVLAVQKLFKKQIAEGTRITYVVKGSWDNPDVKKVVKGKTADASPGSAKDDEAAGQ